MADVFRFSGVAFLFYGVVSEFGLLHRSIAIDVGLGFGQLRCVD